MKMRLLSRCVCGLVMFALGSPLLLPGADEVVEGDHKIAPLDIINIDVVGEKAQILRVISKSLVDIPVRERLIAAFEQPVGVPLDLISMQEVHASRGDQQPLGVW